MPPLEAYGRFAAVWMEWFRLSVGKKLYNLVESSSQCALRCLSSYAFPGRGRPLPPVVLVTLPKSGSIFIHTAIRRTLRIPMVKINASYTFGTSLNYSALVRLAKGGAVCREHFEADEFLLEAMHREGIKRINLHVRDPRGAIVSWTRNMERSNEVGGLASMMLHCQKVLPEAYPLWPFQERLAWQVEHHLPRYVKWIDDWMSLSDRYAQIEFRVTSYESFKRDNRAFIVDLLKFFEVPIEESWITLPKYKVGSANVFHRSEKTVREEMGEALYAKATAMVPAHLVARFGWND